jgi:hypothetical protein
MSKGEFLVPHDYEGVGNFYYFRQSDQTWVGHPVSRSSWVRFMPAPIVMQEKLTRKALSMGMDYDVLRPKRVEVSKPKSEKKSTVSTKKSATFVSLF